MPRASNGAEGPASPYHSIAEGLKETFALYEESRAGKPISTEEEAATDLAAAFMATLSVEELAQTLAGPGTRYLHQEILLAHDQAAAANDAASKNPQFGLADHASETGQTEGGPANAEESELLFYATATGGVLMAGLAIPAYFYYSNAKSKKGSIKKEIKDLEAKRGRSAQELKTLENRKNEIANDTDMQKAKIESNIASLKSKIENLKKIDLTNKAYSKRYVEQFDLDKEKAKLEALGNWKKTPPDWATIDNLFPTDPNKAASYEETIRPFINHNKVGRLTEEDLKVLTVKGSPQLITSVALDQYITEEGLKDATALRQKHSMLAALDTKDLFYNDKGLMTKGEMEEKLTQRYGNDFQSKLDNDIETVRSKIRGHITLVEADQFMKLYGNETPPFLTRFTSGTSKLGDITQDNGKYFIADGTKKSPIVNVNETDIKRYNALRQLMGGNDIQTYSNRAIDAQKSLDEIPTGRLKDDYQAFVAKTHVADTADLNTKVSNAQADLVNLKQTTGAPLTQLEDDIKKAKAALATMDSSDAKTKTQLETKLKKGLNPGLKAKLSAGAGIGFIIGGIVLGGLATTMALADGQDLQKRLAELEEAWAKVAYAE